MISDESIKQYIQKEKLSLVNMVFVSKDNLISLSTFLYIINFIGKIDTCLDKVSK